MSVMTVTEYACMAIAQVGGMMVQVPQEPPLAEQAIAITGSSTTTAACNPNTTLLRINIDGTAAAAVSIGISPTATVPTGGLGSGRMSANASEFRGVPKGQNFKVAVIATT